MNNEGDEASPSATAGGVDRAGLEEPAPLLHTKRAAIEDERGSPLWETNCYLDAICSLLNECSREVKQSNEQRTPWVGQLRYQSNLGSSANRSVRPFPRVFKAGPVFRERRSVVFQFSNHFSDVR